MSRLDSDNPVERHQACEALRSTDSRANPAVRARVIELLADGRDWDCGHFVCGAAAQALVRIDPSAAWIIDARSPFMLHLSRGRPDAARAIVIGVRQATTPQQFMEWCWDAQPDEAASGDDLASTVTSMLSNWWEDEELVDALMRLEDIAAIRYLLTELVGYELVLRHMLRDPGMSLDLKARTNRVLQSISRWTTPAPLDIRDIVTTRAREMGLSI